MENSYEAEQIASRLKLALPHLKCGSLRLWGDWFGGRAFENALKITDCDARDEVLHIQFDGDESLYVWSPQQAELNRTVFRIQNAARVRFEWFYYGRPKTDQNRYFMDFTRTDHRIDPQNNGTLILRPMDREPAVEFVAGMIDGLWDGHWG
jgi:hypothetical protein